MYLVFLRDYYLNLRLRKQKRSIATRGRTSNKVKQVLVSNKQSLMDKVFGSFQLGFYTCNTTFFFLSCLCTFISICNVSWQKGPLVSMPSLSLSLVVTHTNSSTSEQHCRQVNCEYKIKINQLYYALCDIM